MDFITFTPKCKRRLSSRYGLCIVKAVENEISQSLNFDVSLQAILAKKAASLFIQKNDRISVSFHSLSIMAFWQKKMRESINVILRTISLLAESGNTFKISVVYTFLRILQTGRFVWRWNAAMFS